MIKILKEKYWTYRNQCWLQAHYDELCKRSYYKMVHISRCRVVAVRTGLIWSNIGEPFRENAGDVYYFFPHAKI